MKVLDWKEYDNTGKMMSLKEIEYDGKKYINIFKLLNENTLVSDDFIIDDKTIKIINLSKCFHHYYFANYKWRCTELAKAVLGDFIDINEYNTGIDHVFMKNKYRSELVNLSNLSSGDVVLFDRDDEENDKQINYVHATIYLTDDLFVSKFGGEILCITSMNEIHRLYETCVMHRLDIKKN